jgi:mannose-6-phosphate isomerase-like protein (cupin superfamily)
LTQRRLVIHEAEGEVSPDICGIAIELINRKTSGATKISFAKLIIRPGEKSRTHYHKKTEEIYYILSGTGKIIINNKSFNIGPGHAILLPLGSHHQIINKGDNDLIFVCADAPVFDPSDVFEDD